MVRPAAPPRPKRMRHPSVPLFGREPPPLRGWAPHRCLLPAVGDCVAAQSLQDLGWPAGARRYTQRRMVKTWLVRLELARDDDGTLSDEGVDALIRLLAEEHAKPVLTRADSGTIRVQMTVDAKDDRTAKSAAEHMLRDGANTVWSALGLPPFTIAFVDATEGPL
jgi:hypothetical protein